MALESEEQDEKAPEPKGKEAGEPNEEAAAAAAADDDDSSSMIDLDDGVDVVPNTETVVLGLGASSSSSSSTSKSSVDPDELEVLPDPDGVELTDSKEAPGANDKVELVKRIRRSPLASPGLTTPGDISSTDSDSSSDSPVREIAGEISDGEGGSPSKRKHACIVPLRKRHPVRTAAGRGKIAATACAVPIGLDELGDGGAVGSDDDIL